MSCQRLHTSRLWLEALREVLKCELDDVPQLVAELAIANDTRNVQVDGVLHHVGHEGKAKRVGTALRDTLWELCLLVLDSFLDFCWRQVRFVKLLEQSVEITAIKDLKRVNDVALGL